MKKGLMKSVVLGMFIFSTVACTNKTASHDTAGCCSEKTDGCKNKKEMKYSKKYTNADFYTDGKFNQEVALQAYKDMFEFYGVPFTPFMEKEMWVVDFGLGDFEHVGMGGVFWVNDPVHNYFAHAIYLLPGQMIAEHAHVRTAYAPKFESWMVTKGWVYNFSEVGEATPDVVPTPESHAAVRSKNYVVQHVGEIIHLKKEETFHFMMAGPEGAIVDEWASYHDGAGLRFSDPKAAL
ncbi:MAG: hypothetical protein LBQ78_04425 [Tannerellaceae bacterium]|nr:hypothetical protein [Tannerellaceae bacterium]